jgi:hypothetical protein
MSSSSSATQPVFKAGGPTARHPAWATDTRVFSMPQARCHTGGKKLISKVMNGNNRAQGSCINLRNNQTFQASTEFRLFSTE